MTKTQHRLHKVNVTELEGLENVVKDLKASIEQLDAIQKSIQSRPTERPICHIQNAINAINRLMNPPTKNN